MKKKGNNDEDTVGILLFDIEESDLETTKKMLQRIWNKRKRIEKELKIERETREKPKEKGKESMVIKKKKEKQDKKKRKVR